MELLTIAQAAKKLGVHANSLRNYEKRGLIKPARLPSGQRRYSMEDLSRVLSYGNLPMETATVLYGRVSTKKQADAGNLERQLERLREYAKTNNLMVRGEFSDVASGLNQQRRGLAKILKMAESGEYKKLLIEYPDRLARFGYSFIERHLRYCGVEIVVIAEKEPEDSQSELVKDLLWVVTSFSARLYGARGGRRMRDGVCQLMSEVTANGQAE